jgi:hypothetical protein
VSPRTLQTALIHTYIHTYIHTWPSIGSSEGKLKGKIIPVLFFLTEHHATKTCWETGGIAPCILDFGTRWM